MSHTGGNAGNPAHYVVLAGNSQDGLAHGGRSEPPPPVVNRRVQVRATDHPRTDRWIVLTTVRLAPSPLFRVGVVDGNNRTLDPPLDYPTLRRARTAANNLHTRLTEEN